MRKSFVASAAIVTVLAIATPAAAAPRDRDHSGTPSIVQYIKSAFSKVFKVKSTSHPTVPIPGPVTGN